MLIARKVNHYVLDVVNLIAFRLFNRWLTMRERSFCVRAMLRKGRGTEIESEREKNVTRSEIYIIIGQVKRECTNFALRENAIYIRFFL